MSSKTKYTFISLSLFLVLSFGTIFSLPDQKLHLIFCDVGQGDAILITRGQTQVLIDGGPNNQVLGCLSKHMPFWDRNLELVILTHPEADHLTGLISVVERYNVRQLLGNSLINETGVFSKFREEVIKQKIPVYSPKRGDKIKLGKLELKIRYPLEKLGDEIVWKKSGTLSALELATFGGNFNQTAIVFELIYGKFKALLTGDIGVKEENQIQIEPAEVLKVAHHGSKYSTGKEFLEKVQPALAVISVGASNRYGHPHPETLERLREVGIKILRTDLNGEIEIVSDGQTWYTKN